MNAAVESVSHAVDTEHALRLNDVHKSFGNTAIIRGANLDIVKGERHAIIGPNGAGKSTTFHLISGKITPTSGAIQLHGEDITGLSPQEIARKGLSRSFQVTSLFANMSVFENIRCALLWPMGHKYTFWRLCSSLKRVNERAEEILEEVSLTHRRDVPVGLLSYAEQRAIEIGLTVAGGGDVILLDEPTAGMSRSETENAIGLIEKVTEGKSLLMVEHDMGVVFNLADRISVLVYGQIIATDTPEKIKQNAAVQEAYLGVEVD